MRWNSGPPPIEAPKNDDKLHWQDCTARVFGQAAVPAVPGVHAATGLGSRGLLWAPLGAELIASQLESEPLPLPRDLAGAISPRRFLS